MAHEDQLHKNLEQVKTEIKSPLPTPPVGTLVNWYDRAKADGPRVAAVVTKIEGPGRITVTTFRPMGMAEHKQGCLHMDHSMHKNRFNSVSRNSGGWDYIEGAHISKKHYELHLEQLRKKKETIEEAIAAKQVQEAATEA